ncbi:MAG: EF-P lysine aminoacylase EpmA [Myxococcota bacterium]
MDTKCVHTARVEVILKRARIMQAIRHFFERQGFVEVDTPIALTAPAPEPNINAPQVTLRSCDASFARFLQTSPELPMKRVIAWGLPRIYQIAAVFRDGDFSDIHRPEFRLLEWYRRDSGWEELLADCEALLRQVAEVAETGQTLVFENRQVNIAAPFERLSVEDLFLQHLGFSILDALDQETLQARLVEIGLHVEPEEPWEDLFFRAFVGRIEPEIARMPRPVFVTHYPTPLAALARPVQGDPRASERFELYVGGLELANGFGELTCPHEQRRRFLHDSKRRAQTQRATYPLDENFLSDLSLLPEAAGIALGVERLLMLVLGVDNIDAVNPIPWSES